MKVKLPSSLILEGVSALTITTIMSSRSHFTGVQVRGRRERRGGRGRRGRSGGRGKGEL